MCAIYPERVVNITICTQPSFGHRRNNSFWYGKPPYGNHSILDAFLKYHTILMGAYVVYNDLRSESSDFISAYEKSGMISYRTGWILDELGDFGVYDYENLAETTCIFESRLTSRWVMIVHSVDNYVLPMEFNVTLSELAGKLDVDNINAAEVPIVIPHTSIPLQLGNVLLRWNLLGEYIPDRGGRHTPLGNPRLIAWSWVHWLALYPKQLNTTKYLNAIDTFYKLNLTTVHAMGITRPELDEHKGHLHAWYKELAARLQNILE